MSNASPLSASTGLELYVGFSDRVPLPSLRGLAGALFDFNLVYELGVILSDPEYSGYIFSDMRFWRRDGRPIRPEHLAKVLAVRHESPTELLIAIPTAILATGGGLWAFWQTLERVLDRPLNRRILESKVRQSLAEERKALADAAASEIDVRLRTLDVPRTVSSGAADDRRAGDFEDRLVRRVVRGEIVPSKIEIDGERLDT